MMLGRLACCCASGVFSFSLTGDDIRFDDWLVACLRKLGELREFLFDFPPRCELRRMKPNIDSVRDILWPEMSGPCLTFVSMGPGGLKLPPRDRRASPAAKLAPSSFRLLPRRKRPTLLGLWESVAMACRGLLWKARVCSLNLSTSVSERARIWGVALNVWNCQLKQFAQFAFLLCSGSERDLR